MNEELKRTEFDRAFCKKIKLLVDRFSSFFFFIHSKKNRGHRKSKIVKFADWLAQLVEHRTAVQEVAGSNLGPTLRVFK